MTLENTQTHGRNAGPSGPAFLRLASIEARHDERICASVLDSALPEPMMCATLFGLAEQRAAIAGEADAVTGSARSP